MHLSTRIKAIGALVITGILGGLAPLFMKITLKEFNSFQILFIRFGLASFLVVPLLIKNVKKVITIKNLIYTIPAGLLFSSNVFFFVVGVQYTTSIVSQLLYLITPVIVSLVSYLLFREKISMRRIFSMVICFGGSSLLILRSIQRNSLINSIGTFQGNVLILCAVVSWAFYVVYTKRISKKIEPSLFLVTNFMTAFLISSFGFFITKTSFISTIVHFSQSSFPAIASLLVLAIVNLSLAV